MMTAARYHRRFAHLRWANRRTRRRILSAIAIGVSLLLTLAACNAPQRAETRSFEIAEDAYQDALYEEALQGYQSFLHQYPDSPLADTARLRIRCIRREVQALLGRKDMPKPVYLKPVATTEDDPFPSQSPTRTEN